MKNTAITPSNFWFVELFNTLKLPFLLGIVLVALLPTVLEFADCAVGCLNNGITNSVFENDLIYFALLLYFQIGALYIGRQTERALDYAESIGSGQTDQMQRKLYSIRWGLLIFVVLQAFFALTFVGLGGIGSFMDIFRQNFLPIPVVLFVTASALWAFIYSMKILYNLGRAPLTLKSFAEDRTLGLKPFGNVALKIVAVYEVGLVIITAPSIIERNLSPLGIPLDIFLAMLGFFSFFFSLLSFRSKLKQEKATELSWIGPRYFELLNAFKAENSSHGVYADEKIVSNLSALDKIQRDVQQIHSWPFDIGIVTRLASITILPLLVTVLAREVMLIVLHV